MPNISSSRTFSMMSSSSATREHTFLSQFLLTMAIVILFIGCCPYVSSSPTPSSIDPKNQINYASNGLMLDPNELQATGDSSSSSSSSPVHQSPPIWYVQPRAHANQFLMSHGNENQIVVSKRFTRFNTADQTDDSADDDDDDEFDDYVPSNQLPNKRSSTGNHGRYANLSKRKQISKPPMEVMNEIVNSIYLKR